MSKYGHSTPYLPIVRIFKNMSIFQNRAINTLPTSPQPRSNHVSNSCYAYFCVLGHICPNMEIRSQISEFLELLKINKSFKIVLKIQKCVQSLCKYLYVIIAINKLNDRWNASFSRENLHFDHNIKITRFRSLSDTLEMSTILFCEVVTHRNTLKHQNRIHHKRVLGST